MGWTTWESSLTGRVLPCHGSGWGFNSPLSRLFFAPVTELVDVLDLGSRFWEFKSPPGYLPSHHTSSPLGETVDAAALKAAPILGIGSSPVVGTGSYSLVVK